VNTGGVAADRYIYATWCDTQLTPTSGADFIIFKNYVDFTASFTLKAYAGISTGNRGFCAWVCRNLDPTPDNVAFMRIPDTIASLVTLQLDGLVILSTHGGFRAGTSTNPIAADLCKIVLPTPTVGTVGGSGFTDAAAFQAGGSETARCSLFFYGVSPARREAISTAQVNVGATAVNVDDVTGFAVDDFIMIGKRQSYLTDECGAPRHRITSIVGNTINFTAGLLTSPSIAGAKVIKTYNNATNNTGYGVSIRRTGGTTAYSFASSTGLFSNLFCVGVFFELAYFLGSNNQASVEDAAYNAGYYFEDCIMLNSTALNSYGQAYAPFLQSGPAPIRGTTFDNCIFTKSGIVGGFVYGNILSGNPAVSYAGGFLRLYDITIMRCPTNGVVNGTLDFPNSAAIPQEGENIYVDSVGAGRAGLFVGGVNSRWDGIEVWGANVGTGGNSGAVRIANLIKGTVNDVTINSSLVGINFEGVNSDSVITNVTFGNEVANTWDIASNGKAFSDVQIKGITGNPVIDMTTIANTAEATQIGFQDVNAANVDYTLQTYGDIYRTGTGLADTTAHTAGGYAMRFQPKSSTSATYWRQDLPVGNIQSLTMSLGVWININNAAYWAGTHQMPRLTVTFDNGADSEYVEAAQVTGWQFIQTAITPTTTFGQISIEVSGKTDAAGSNAYFYVDDFTAPLPQGSNLNLGSMDLWSGGLPVSPVNFATSISAADVWAADPTQFGAGTVGEKVNGIALNVADIPLDVWSEVMESTFTAKELVRIMAAVLAGKVSGAGTGTEVFRSVDDTKDRLIANVSDVGNRTAITLDVS
jgi:hypothetical protein